MTGENISGAVEQQNLSGTVEQPAVEPNMAVEFMSFLAEYNVVGMAVGLLVATKVGNLVKGIIEDFVWKGASKFDWFLDHSILGILGN